MRGNAMDFVDSATGTDVQHPETDVGPAQTEEGVERMAKGRHGTMPAAASSTHAPTNTSGQPPLPPRNAPSRSV